MSVFGRGAEAVSEAKSDPVEELNTCIRGALNLAKRGGQEDREQRGKDTPGFNKRTDPSHYPGIVF